MQVLSQMSAAVLVLVFSIAASADASNVGDRVTGNLQATVLGSHQTGETGRVAVKWGGAEATVIDGWLDVAGDGRWEAAVQVLDNVVVEPGMTVLEFTAPRNTAPCRRLELRIVAGDGQQTMVSTVTAPEGAGVCGWQEGFHVNDLDSVPGAIVVFDDGGGPDVYAGGHFTMANGLRVNRVARWDGSAWTSVGVGFTIATPGNPYVQSLVVFDSGGGDELYAAGRFDTAGGVPVQNIARWNGSSWSAVGGGLANNSSLIYVGSMTVWDDGGGAALYAGGKFDEAGGAPVNNIARWDGAAWSALGSGVDHQVNTMAVFDDGGGSDLYVGGYFENAGAAAAARIARWDGAAWSVLGSGLDDGVESLAVFDDGGGADLYAGGSFTTAGGVPSSNIARWDGSSWSALGAGVTGSILALESFDDGGGSRLFAGGIFDTAGGVPADNIAQWTGGGWLAVDGGTDNRVSALAAFDDGSGAALYVGGQFGMAGATAVNRIARWTGSSWLTLEGPAGNGLEGSTVNAIAGFRADNHSLYAGGNDFVAAGGVASRGIARWQCSAIFSDGFESGDTNAWGGALGEAGDIR